MRTAGTIAITAVTALAAATFMAPPVAAAPRIQWQACQDGALKGFECGTLEVAKDWNSPADGTWTLAVIRHRSTGTDKQRVGSLFFNPGGPGGSGVQSSPFVWDILPKQIKQAFDLVSWDPRGVGGSNPLSDCTGTASAPVPASGPVDWDAAQAQLRESYKVVNKQCMDLHPDLVPLLGTNQVVRDLDALRAAVGDRQLTYWGMSYGTRIGYTYQLTFPQKVRAILLDGSVNPNGSIQDFSVGYGGGVDNAVKLYAQYYPGVYKQLTRLTKATADGPLALGGGVTFSRWTPAQIIDALIRMQQDWPRIDRALKQAVTAFYGAPAAKAKARTWLRRALKPQGLTDDIPGADAVVAAIDCLDYPDRVSGAEMDATARSIRAQSPLIGWRNYAMLAAQCEGFSPTPDPVPTDFGTVDSSKVLILGATRDPATPFAWTAAMGRAMKDSRVITTVTTQHVNYMSTPSQCVNNPVTRFFVTGKQPKHDLGCATAIE